jgi:hypothetical protein
MLAAEESFDAAAVDHDDGPLRGDRVVGFPLGVRVW